MVIYQKKRRLSVGVVVALVLSLAFSVAIGFTFKSYAFENVSEEVTYKTIDDIIGEGGLGSIGDNDGMSYYYSGNDPDNYVNFAGNIWRIIRINGDGTVRLISTTNYGRSVASGQYMQENMLQHFLELKYSENGLDRYNNIIVEGKYCSDNALCRVARENGYRFACSGENLYSARIGLPSVDELALGGEYLKTMNWYWTASRKNEAVNCGSEESIEESYTNFSVNSNFYINNQSGAIYGDSAFGSYGVNSNSENVYPVINLRSDTKFVGSGTSDDPYRVIYEIKEGSVVGGTISISGNISDSGREITFVLNPYEGYAVKQLVGYSAFSISVKDNNGDDVVLSELGEGRYSFIMPNSDVTLSVVFAKINKYTMSFETNGGTAVADITQDYGTAVSAPTTTKNGYTFDGWYSEATFDNEYTFTTMPAEDLTLYAKWVDDISVPNTSGNLNHKIENGSAKDEGAGYVMCTVIAGIILIGYAWVVIFVSRRK